MDNHIVLSTIFDNQVLSVEFKNTEKSNALSLKMLTELLELLSKKKIVKKYKLLVFKIMNYPDFIDPIAISIPISGFWGDYDGE